MKHSTTLKLLRTALADELLATYQYWICWQTAVGNGSNDAITEFKEHFEEELNHANKIANRIKMLNGKLIYNPKNLEKFANPWVVIRTKDVSEQIDTTLAAERGAIKFYESAIDSLDDDTITIKLFKEILEDEKKHEEDLMKLQNKISVPPSGEGISKSIFLD